MPKGDGLRTSRRCCLGEPAPEPAGFECGDDLSLAGLVPGLIPGAVGRGRFPILDQVAQGVFTGKHQRSVIGREAAPAGKKWLAESEVGLAIDAGAHAASRNAESAPVFQSWALVE